MPSKLKRTEPNQTAYQLEITAIYKKANKTTIFNEQAVGPTMDFLNIHRKLEILKGVYTNYMANKKDYFDNYKIVSVQVSWGKENFENLLI